MPPGILRRVPSLAMPPSDCRRLALPWLAVAIGVMAPVGTLAQPAEPPVDTRTIDPIPPAAPAPPGYFLLPIPGGQPVFDKFIFPNVE